MSVATVSFWHAEGTALTACAETDLSLVRYGQSVANRRSPGLPLLPWSALVCRIPMPLWSALVVSLLAVQPYHAGVDHMVPPEGHGRDGDAFGSGFFVVRGSPEEAAHLAALRERFGDEMVDHLQRSWELMRHPRPLTESEREVIWKAMAPVLRDLEVTGAIVPEVRYEAHGDVGLDAGREGVHAWITADGIGGMGVWIPTEETSLAEQVRLLADQVQEWEVEELWRAGRSATRPECPEHPNSHPLKPAIDGKDTAVWRCPRSGHVICAIGALDSRR